MPKPNVIPLEFPSEETLEEVKVSDICRDVLTLLSNYPTDIAVTVLKKSADMLSKPPENMTVKQFLEF